MAKRVLVIDDEAAIADLIKINLEDEGYEVKTAFSGPEGLDLIKDFKPDLITLDVMMPEMNGFQVMELLKHNPQTAGIPVIFVSIVEGVQKERGFHLGAVDFLSKPIEFGDLFKSIKAVEAGIDKHASNKKDILVIDDERDTANLIKEYMDSEGYNAIVAYNGPDGIALARERKPELIICDLRMPGMDGFAVIKVLKQDKETEHIPVVVLTGHDTRGYKEKCAMLGATHYVTKPFTTEELIKEITGKIGKP